MSNRVNLNTILVDVAIKDAVSEDLLDNEILKEYDEKELGVESIVTDPEILEAIRNIEQRKKEIRKAQSQKESNNE